MKDICLTHFDTDIRLTTYFLYYFRIIGVYVYDRVIQLDEVIDKHLEDFGKGLDLQVVVISRPVDYQWIKDNMRQNSIYLIPEEFSHTIIASEEVIEREDSKLKRQIIYFGQHESNIQILKNLINRLAKNDKEFKKDKKNLLELADIYDRHFILETILGTRFALTDHENIQRLCQNYDNAFDEICDSEVIDTDSKFVGFTMAYLAYEYNYYCKRLDKLFLYNVDSMFDMMMKLQKEEEEWTSLDLLFAQVYDDLLGEIDKAYVYYISALERKYCAFAWYKMGNIWKNRYDEPDVAINYYKKAVKIYPSYYRAIFKVSECYADMKSMEEAKESYLSLIYHIALRKEEKIVCPMEVEYLFKTYMNLGKIEWNYFDNMYAALQDFQEAKWLWEEFLKVGQNRQFINVMCGGSIKGLPIKKEEFERHKQFETEINRQFNSLKVSLDIGAVDEWIHRMKVQVENYEELERYKIEKLYSKKHN